MDSWLDQVAFAYGVNRRRLIDYYELPTRLGSPIDALGGSLTQSEVEHLAAVFALNADDQSTLLQGARRIETLAGRYRLGYRLPELAPRRASLFCPLCLDDESGWLTAWRRVWSEVCPTHEVTLVQECPDCSNPQRAEPVRARSAVRDERICEKCEGNLAAIRPAPAPEGKLRRQRLIDLNDELLDNEPIRGDIQSLALVALRRFKDHGQVDVSTVLAAALGDDDCLTRVLALIPAKSATRGLPSAFDHASTSLRERASVELQPRSNGLKYLRTFRPASRCRDDWDPRITARFTPSDFWPTIVRNWEKDTQTSNYLTPKALAIATVLTGNTFSEEECAQLLGLSTSRQWANRIVGLNQRASREQLDAIGEIAFRCQSQQMPIDFERRRQLDASSLLTPEDWDAICLLSGVELTPRHGWLGTELARAVLTATSARFGDTRWLGRVLSVLPHEVFGRLHTHLRAALQNNGIDEPLVWDFSVTDADRATTAEHLHDLFAAGRSATAAAAAVGATRSEFLCILVGGGDLLSASRLSSPRAFPYEVTGAMLAARFNGGESFRSIASDFDVDRKRVAEIVKLAGQKRHKRASRVSLRPDELSRRYATQTLGEIARDFRTSNSTVARIAKDARLSTRRGAASHRSHVRSADSDCERASTYPSPLRLVATGPLWFQRLERFISAAPFQTLADAARALSLDRALLSEQIKRLEVQAGEVLLTRGSTWHPQSLTDAGTLLISQASLHLADQLGDQASRAAKAVKAEKRWPHRFDLHHPSLYARATPRTPNEYGDRPFETHSFTSRRAASGKDSAASGNKGVPGADN